MKLVDFVGFLLIIYSGIVIVHNLVVNYGTACFDILSMVLSLFALMYSVFMRVVG